MTQLHRETGKMNIIRWICLAALLAVSGVSAEEGSSGWLTTEVAFTLETFSVLDGGLERDSGLLGNLDLTVEVDTEKAGLWKNGRFFCYALGNFGDNPTEAVGDVQGTSNIEAPETLKLYEAWYEHFFFGEQFTLLGGLHDYNSEFDALAYAGLFLNSSFGISPDISQVGPSIFPATALALRSRVELETGVYLLGAVYDGIPGDPGDDRGTQVILKTEDGIFCAVEGGFVHGEPGTPDYCKVGVGAWFHTAEYLDFSGNARDSNSGVYAIAERALTEKLGVFAQLGRASESRNPIELYAGGGLHWRGLLLADDLIGVAVAHARNGDDYLRVAAASERAETAVEVTWQVPVADWLSVQPSLQYVMNPGMDPVVDNALVFQLRVTGTY